MEGLVFNLVIMSICGAASAAIASSKGRNTVGWFFGGFFLGIIGIIIVAVLPNIKVQREKEQRQEMENRRLREQLRQERIKSEATRNHVAQRLDAHDAELGIDTRHTLPADNAMDERDLLPDNIGSNNQPASLDALDSNANPNPHAAPPPPSAAGAGQRKMRHWYYERDGAVQGPVREPQMLQMVRNGEIDAATLLWTEELDDWRAARDIRALQSYFSI